MKVLFTASEAVPFAKTGGLGDVAGSLPSALAGLGHDVRLALPLYRDVSIEGLMRVATFYVPVASWRERCDVYEGRTGDVTVYFIRKDALFDRPGLYGIRGVDYPDNAERFVFFSRAVLGLCSALRFRPGIIHANDWQTGLAPLYARKLAGEDPFLANAATVFTVHNLGYQGLFGPEEMRLLGLGADIFTPEGVEFWGKLSFIKAGLVFAHALTTVSPTYSAEIQTPEFGCGLEGVLARRSADLYGILNGIDYGEWDPSRDSALPATYSTARLEGKRACARELRIRAGLPASDAPLLGMVTRITGQKGLDILVDALPALLASDIQLVILGTGDEKYRKLLAGHEERSGGRMRLLFSFDESLARLIYAGADIFLMPSRYEPCGLSQMIALRYGTVPVVRRTGGLRDTVTDHDPATGEGTGFVFDEYAPDALADCVGRAVSAFQDHAGWRRIMRSGMAMDFSWSRSAQEYIKVYRKAIQKKQGMEQK